MATSFENIAITRDDGIIELRVHHRAGTAVWAAWGGLHRELGIAFAEIAADPTVKAVILRGTGDDFCAELVMSGDMPPLSAATWDVILQEGCALLQNLLAIPVPIIAAVHGRAFIHAELPLLADIVLASDSAVFADKAHAVAGVVPGDGVQTIWPMLLGPNRGRYFLLTGQEIAAREALALGLVGEVLPAEDLYDKAWEHARIIAARPAHANRYTRQLLTRHLRERLSDELEHGLALEGMAILASMPPAN